MADLVDIFSLSLSAPTAPLKETAEPMPMKVPATASSDCTASSTIEEVDVDEDTELLYSSLVKTEDFENNDVRIAMIGNVDSGKSTLIGVLMSASLDDGRGAARGLVLKHRHEQENGRTSAVTVEIMGYDKQDQQVVATSRGHAQRWQGASTL
jgi:GTPase